ncbi:MAG TPA: sulfide/dihydroorotate dehydrogenase-like FAD/NAD-binding protein [Gaiellaceae bacterium]|nr:sulfide/dihydroorotate dehydrogenase-like FAD/NAD-binding protein [Gaiellaceae bacterium]
MARILDKLELTPVTRLFVVDAPLVARHAQPGQFVIVRVDEHGERVPISITDFDPEAGTVTLVVQEVGRTSGLLCALEPGEELLDLAGPLGRPAPLPDTGHAALVGGGFGAGAIYPIARELRRRGVRVTSIVGARTAGLLILRELLEPASDAYEPCTDDGSLGYHGFTAARLGELVEQGAGFTSCFAVGPMPMMRAVAETTRPSALPTFVSLDPIMLDGTGMCGACRITVGGETRFACVDGPFFDAHAVDFDEAVVRSKMYVDEERVAREPVLVDTLGGA